MLTVLEAINLSTDFLAKKNIESPRINSEHLLAHVLNCKRLDLYLSFDRPLKEEELDTYRELLRRRGKAEPLQYILGKVEFFGLEFKINKSVLIPRPETEILVEKIIECCDRNIPIKILDIGTGSGNIAVSLAKNLTCCNVVAIDISEEALETAAENSLLNNTDKRIVFKKYDFMNENNLEQESFGLIVSNPPYVSAEEFPSLRPELKVYEPRIALTDNSDGLNFYRSISAAAKTLLKSKGKIFFEVGEGQAESVKNILLQNNFSEIGIFKDYSNIDRVIKGVLS